MKTAPMARIGEVGSCVLAAWSQEGCMEPSSAPAFCLPLASRAGAAWDGYRDGKRLSAAQLVHLAKKGTQFRDRLSVFFAGVTPGGKGGAIIIGGGFVVQARDP